MAYQSLFQTPSSSEMKLLEEDFDKHCKLAAEAILNSSCFYLGTGAGFSAESGLAVYKDIADVPAYNERELTYHDLCQPSWLRRDPETFFGFWGKCFNDYRQSTSHEGYSIIQKWKNEFFSGYQNREKDDERISPQDFRLKWIEMLPEQSKDHPEMVCDPFFAYTSNVDHHHHRFFGNNEISEIHGNIEKWQCSMECHDKHIEPPPNFFFDIDEEKMLAPTKKSTIFYTSKHESDLTSQMQSLNITGLEEQAPSTGNKNNNVNINLVPKTDNTKNNSEDINNTTNDNINNTNNNSANASSERTNAPTTKKTINSNQTFMEKHNLVRNNSPDIPEHHKPFLNNHPRCDKCNEYLRPAILMFGDGHWISESYQQQQESSFDKVMEYFIRASEQTKNPNFKVVLMEIGCGLNVPSVRCHMQLYMQMFPFNTTLFRINPVDVGPEIVGGEKVIRIKSKAVPALKRIDEWITKLKAEKLASQALSKPESENSDSRSVKN